MLDHTQMRFPLLAKPYFTDGRQGSHGLALIKNLEGLKRLVNGTGPPGVALPVMLQPFIEHGGCLFKVRLLHTSSNKEDVHTRNAIYVWYNLVRGAHDHVSAWSQSSLHLPWFGCRCM